MYGISFYLVFCSVGTWNVCGASSNCQYIFSMYNTIRFLQTCQLELWMNYGKRTERWQLFSFCSWFHVNFRVWTLKLTLFWTHDVRDFIQLSCHGALDMSLPTKEWLQSYDNYLPTIPSKSSSSYVSHLMRCTRCHTAGGSSSIYCIYDAAICEATWVRRSPNGADCWRTAAWQHQLHGALFGRRVIG